MEHRVGVGGIRVDALANDQARLAMRVPAGAEERDVGREIYLVPAMDADMPAPTPVEELPAGHAGEVGRPAAGDKAALDQTRHGAQPEVVRQLLWRAAKLRRESSSHVMSVMAWVFR